MKIYFQKSSTQNATTPKPKVNDMVVTKPSANTGSFHRNAKGFLVQSVDISKVPTIPENEYQRQIELRDAIENLNKSLQETLKTQSLSLNP